MKPVWIVDDDPSIRFVLERALARAQLPVRAFAGPHEVIAALDAGAQPQVLVTDIRMPQGSGIALLADVKRRLPGVPVIITTAHTDLDSAVGAFQGGAFEYLPKPFDVEKAVELIRRAASESLREEGAATEASDWPRMLGQAPAMQEVFRAIGRLSQSDATVLITGASGTGKELVAHALHRHSPRADGPFVAINAAAIPKDLLESELFGHEKGAFTGALSARKGRFEMAEGGTLLLDEIGDMSLPMQVKLLRVLQERSFERVGGNQTIRCNVRVIAATHRNLEARIADGHFREDLFYRLNVFPIEMPALRERADDLPDLVMTIAAQLSRTGRGEVRFANETLQALRLYAWPGNVRELTNLVERLAVLHPGGLVRVADLPKRYQPEHLDAVTAEADAVPAQPAAAAPSMATAVTPTTIAAAAVVPADRLPEAGIDLREHIAQIELNLIRDALDRAGGVVAHAAQLLGLRRTTLVEKLRKYGVEREDVALATEN